MPNPPPLVIELPQSLLQDYSRLHEYLESLYVQGGRYKLSFDQAYLMAVEKAFDDVIFRHGLLASDFLFDLLGSVSPQG